ncbi:minor capsid protein [Paracoccus binzhouensis]|uniref:minor capsid protein n=1 Tax=Paracoccus binzhouensis TaxID=2796149 RepID=UPI0018EF295B|nr:minor capsid protein [Paracoccus binzhouensis]
MPRGIEGSRHEHDPHGSLSNCLQRVSAQRHPDPPLSLKQAGTTARYVWRCQGDDRVRMTHRANDGRVFAWDDPPTTGPPGEDYNCRCEAVPYIPGETEFAFHDFTSVFTPNTIRWENLDFVNHDYFGGGQAVTLDEIGHLRDIAEQYAYRDGTEGAFRRLSGQIADAARGPGTGPVHLRLRSRCFFSRVGDGQGAILGRR